MQVLAGKALINGWWRFGNTAIYLDLFANIDGVVGVKMQLCGNEYYVAVTDTKGSSKRKSIIGFTSREELEDMLSNIFHIRGVRRGPS